jgi:hypothetical protein
MATILLRPDQVVAERNYRLHRRAKRGLSVQARIGRPIPDPNAPTIAWACPYELLVSGKRRPGAVYGEDSLQALELALQLLPTLLGSLAREYDAEVHRFGSLDRSIPRLPRRKRTVVPPTRSQPAL